MPGRIHQAMNRAAGVRQRRQGQLAELIANGATVAEAGRRLLLTPGQTARTWADIKAGLGAQAR